MHTWDLVKAVKIPGIHSYAAPMLYWNNISGKCFCSCFIFFVMIDICFCIFNFPCTSLAFHITLVTAVLGAEICVVELKTFTLAVHTWLQWGPEEKDELWEIVWKQHVYEGNKVDLQLKYCSPCKSLLIAQLHFCFVGPWQEFSQDAFVPWGTPSGGWWNDENTLVAHHSLSPPSQPPPSLAVRLIFISPRQSSKPSLLSFPASVTYRIFPATASPWEAKLLPSRCSTELEFSINSSNLQDSEPDFSPANFRWSVKLDFWICSVASSSSELWNFSQGATTLSPFHSRTMAPSFQLLRTKGWVKVPSTTTTESLPFSSSSSLFRSLFPFLVLLKVKGSS